MIDSKSTYKKYLNEDLKCYGLNKWHFWYGFRYPIVAFVRHLRLIEYISNCHKGLFWSKFLIFQKILFRKRSIFLGFSIPPNTCGRGLKINHWGTIVISPEASIGANARINVCVNIGLKNNLAPNIGDNVYIGPGAKLFGGITIGDNVIIGANSVVNKSFTDGVTIAGVPAEIIKRKNNF